MDKFPHDPSVAAETEAQAKLNAETEVYVEHNAPSAPTHNDVERYPATNKANEVARAAEAKDRRDKNKNEDGPSFKRGHTDATAVHHLQERLVVHRVDVNIDSVFGPKTEVALKAFQTDHDLKSDGVVGPRTLAALDAPQGVGLRIHSHQEGTNVQTRQTSKQNRADARASGRAGTDATRADGSRANADVVTTRTTTPTAKPSR